MRPEFGESYSSWANRVRVFEYNRSLKALSAGQDIDTVMEAMSTRIMRKLMHPCFLSIRNSAKVDNFDESKKLYNEQYISRTNRSANHVTSS
jgi:glutamyl-tRNA reductase